MAAAATGVRAAAHGGGAGHIPAAHERVDPLPPLRLLPELRSGEPVEALRRPPPARLPRPPSRGWLHGRLDL